MENQIHKDWDRPARVALLRLLRRTLTTSPGYERKLWNELLRRLWRSDSALTVAEAIEIVDLKSQPEVMTQVANHLRDKMRDAFKDVEPRLGIHLTTQTYEIGVSESPPEHWKQSAVPSIGLLLADAIDWFVGDLIKGVTSECERRGYHLVIDVSNYDPQIEARKIRNLLKGAKGLLIVPVGHSAFDMRTKTVLRERDCVLIDRFLRDLPEVPCVHPDDISAGRRAGAYLRDSGCQRVIIVGQGSRSESTFAITPLEDRANGCKLEIGEQIEVIGPITAGTDERGGFDALKQFEKRGGLAPTDGIFALTDRVAAGCRHFLAKNGLDCRLIGVEGQPFGEFMEPPLVSIKFDNVEMGRRAAEILFERLRDVGVVPRNLRQHYLIPAQLLEFSKVTEKRESSPIKYPDADSHYSIPRTR